MIYSFQAVTPRRTLTLFGQEHPTNPGTVWVRLRFESDREAQDWIARKRVTHPAGEVRVSLRRSRFG